VKQGYNNVKNTAGLQLLLYFGFFTALQYPFINHGGIFHGQKLLYAGGG